MHSGTMATTKVGGYRGPLAEAIEAEIIPAPELSSQDIYIQITSPERLDLLADQFYGDATLWWIIATTNGLGKGTLFTPEGITIRIPPAQDIQSIIELQNKER